MSSVEEQIKAARKKREELLASQANAIREQEAIIQKLEWELNGKRSNNGVTTPDNVKAWVEQHHGRKT